MLQSFKRSLLDQMFWGAKTSYSSIKNRIVQSFKTPTYEYVKLDDIKAFKRHCADTLYQKISLKEYNVAYRQFINDMNFKQMQKVANRQGVLPIFV